MKRVSGYRRELLMYVAVGAYLALLITPLVIGRAAAETSDKFPDSSGGYTSNVETGTLTRIREEAIEPSQTVQVPAADDHNQTVPPPLETQSSAQAVAAQQFDMGSVERIRLRVWGYADYSGEYVIDTDNTISLPGLGRINVGGVTAAALETMLSEKLSLFARRPVALAVEVAKFRPYYIVGQIGQPGAAEWHPGLNVIQAIALAGGVLRSNSAVDLSGNGTGLAALLQTRTQLKFAMAQLARYKAEKNGTSNVEADEQFAAFIKDTSLNGQAALKTFVERQNATLAEQRALLKTQLDGLERERQSASEEVVATEAQQKLIDGQAALSRSMLSDIEQLKDKKIVANARYMSQRSESMSIEVRSAEIRTMVERARARLAAVERQMISVRQERQTVLNERIETLEREVAQLQSNLPASAQSSAESKADQVTTTISYHVARRSQGGVQMIAANVLADVMPGDVVIVSGEERADQFAAQSSSKEQDVGQAFTPSEGIDRVLEASALSRSPSMVRSGRLGGGTRMSGTE